MTPRDATAPLVDGDRPTSMGSSRQCAINGRVPPSCDLDDGESCDACAVEVIEKVVLKKKDCDDYWRPELVLHISRDGTATAVWVPPLHVHSAPAELTDCDSGTGATNPPTGEIREGQR